MHVHYLILLTTNQLWHETSKTGILPRALCVAIPGYTQNPTGSASTEDSNPPTQSQRWRSCLTSLASLIPPKLQKRKDRLGRAARELGRKKKKRKAGKKERRREDCRWWAGSFMSHFWSYIRTNQSVLLVVKDSRQFWCMLSFPLQSQMPHFWSPQGTADPESFRAVDASKAPQMSQLQPFLCFFPCHCVSRKSSCPGCELPLGLPCPSTDSELKCSFVPISIDLFVTYSLINSESFPF